ncbi:L,D-transpeptidase [Streptomyces nojiriensis]
MARPHDGERPQRPRRGRDRRRTLRRTVRGRGVHRRGPDRGGHRLRRAHHDGEPQRNGPQDDPGHHRQTRVQDPGRGQGRPRQGTQSADAGDSVGIKRGTSEFYDLPVQYATRVTWSGEYVHAAPWSVEAQGEENVSHGCTGMSTEDAAWFFETVREGDIVEVVNSGGPLMEPFGNGIGDWNLDWKAWRAGSALATTYGAPAPGDPPAPSRLSPTT